jgi:hypothetical protein
MFYEIYKGYQQEKIKNKAEKTLLFERSLVIMEILLEL